MKKTQFAKLKMGAAPLVLGVALISAPAFAQDAEEGAEESEIVVTGTLIRNPNLEASSPVTVIGADEVALRQTNTAEQILREIPGVVPNLGQNVNNGQVGSARVDLRGLGANRNIVLLDGKRIVPSNFSGIVDLNNIPLALVDRVDVLTGGASTTYGADAVSGVVNFITKRDFAGMDFTVSQQLTEQGDGNVFRADLVLGANFDDGRGNAVLAVGYQEADPVYFGARDTGTFTINSANGVASGDSPTSDPAAFSSAGSFLQIAPDGQSLVTPYNFFNFNPFNVYATPFERYNIYGAARYEVSDSIEVYARGIFSKNKVQSIIAASGVFGLPLTVPGNNPFLNTNLRNTFCTRAGIALGPTCDTNPAIPLGLVYRRSVELGPRISTYVTQFFDYTMGATVNLTDSISFDVTGSYGESENTETRSGYVSRSRTQQALNATNPNTCIDTSNACVPLNLFGQGGSITEAMGGFIGGITSSVTNASQLGQVRGVFSGETGLTLASDQEVSFAAGAEYRKYGAQRKPDNLASIPGELGGAGGAVLPLDGGFDVKEVFGEIIAPIVTDQPFFNDLTLEAGVRHSKYRVDATNNPKYSATTYKFGVNWEPVESLKLRGNYQRAVRAPNIGELFAPVVTGLTNLLIDPCSGTKPGTVGGPNTAAQDNLWAVCAAQGAPAASRGAILDPAAGQANLTGGGNPNIRPEKATTYTIGAVFQPDFVPNLSISIDYYNIKVANAITTEAPADSIGGCFNTITATSAASAACTRIRRNAVNGRLSGTSTAANPILGLPGPLTNEGRLQTDGIDLVINWKTDLDFATLALNFSGNYTMSSKFRASPTSYDRECVGYFSTNCGISTGLATGSITPKFSWTQRTTLSFDTIDVSLLWRHIDGMEYEGQADDFLARGFTAGSRNLFNGTITGRGALVGRNVNFNKISSYDYFDLTVRMGLTDNLDVTLSAFNIFDKEAPIVGSSAGSTALHWSILRDERDFAKWLIDHDAELEPIGYRWSREGHTPLQLA
ncbi:MAG: TonB-dependent receptor, partial [Sphingopyxis sp.]|nr:TonB-dependent receptor [Sphingopyxis sp.]